MIKAVIENYSFNLRYADALVRDVTDDMMTMSSATGLENHPAFTLGHLAIASALMVDYLGGVKALPEGWSELFERTGPGDPRLPDPIASHYPGKAELMEELTRQHAAVVDILAGCDDERLSEAISWRFGELLETLGDLVVFLCISHEAMHLGQLAAWRRANGLPSALGAIR